MPSVVVAQFPVSPNLLAPHASQVTARSGLSENATASLKDDVFGHYREQPIPRATAARLAQPVTRVEASRDAIERHVERRMQLLFMQMVLCQGTGSTFREGKTLHQGFFASTIRLPGQPTDMKFNAAHTATLPCLYVRSAGVAEETVFLYRSGYYDESNQTEDLILSVNQADTAIDGKPVEQKLRTKTVRLLNQAAAGTLTPQEATRQFAVELIAEINRVRLMHPHDEVGQVLDIYHQKALELQAHVAGDATFDQWLNLQMDDPMLALADEVIRQVAAAEQLETEDLGAVVKRKIHEVPVLIRAAVHRVLNESRTPNHFMRLYLLEVLRCCREDVRPALEALLGTTLQVSELEALAYRNVGETTRLLLNNAVSIEALCREIRPLLLKMQGINVPADDLASLSPVKKVCLRPSVYKLRYEMIRNDQEMQGRIKRAFESVRNGITVGSPQYFELFFHSKILEGRIDSERQTLSRLLNISSQEVTQKVREVRLNKDAHAALEQHASLISRLGADLDSAFRNRTHTPETLAAWIVRAEQLYAQINAVRGASHLELLYRRRVLDYLTDPAAQTWYCASINLTLGALDQAIANQLVLKLRRGRPIKGERLATEHAEAIKTAARTALDEVAQLRAQTATFRTKLVQELRFCHGMNQGYVRAVHAALFPASSMSAGTFSNLENGIKPVTDQVVDQISPIYGVHPGLFQPSHFAS
jgi:hypothetical protein